MYIGLVCIIQQKVGLFVFFSLQSPAAGHRLSLFPLSILTDNSHHLSLFYPQSPVESETAGQQEQRSSETAAGSFCWLVFRPYIIKPRHVVVHGYEKTR